MLLYRIRLSKRFYEYVHYQLAENLLKYLHKEMQGVNGTGELVINLITPSVINFNFNLLYQWHSTQKKKGITMQMVALISKKDADQSIDYIDPKTQLSLIIDHYSNHGTGLQMPPSPSLCRAIHIS